MDSITLLLVLVLVAVLAAIVLLVVLLLRKPDNAAGDRLGLLLRDEQRAGRGELREQLADSIQRTDARLDE